MILTFAPGRTSLVKACNWTEADSVSAGVGGYPIHVHMGAKWKCSAPWYWGRRVAG